MVALLAAKGTFVSYGSWWGECGEEITDMEKLPMVPVRMCVTAL